MRSPSARMPEDLRQSRLLMEFQAQQQQQQQQQRHAPRANVYEHGEPRSLFNRERSSANTAAPYSGARPPPSMSGLHSVDDATGEVYSVRSSSRLTSSSQEDVVTAPLPPPPPPPRGRRLGIDVDGDDHHHHDDSGRMYMRGDTELQIPSPYRMRTEGSHARLPTQTLMADDVVETPWNSREKQRGTNNLNVRRCCSNSPRRGRAPPPPPPPPPTYTSSSSALLSPRAAAAAPPPPPPPEGRGPTSSRRSSMAPPTTHNAHVRERAYSPSQWTSVVPSADFDPRHQRGARRPVLTPPAPSAHTTRTTTTTTPPAADVRCVASSWEEAQREVRDSRNTSVNGDDDEVERRGGWRSWALEVNDRRLSEWQRGESLLLRRTSSSCSAMDVGGTRQRRGSWGAAPPPPPPPSATAATAAARMTMDASRRASSTASSCWAQPIQQQQQQQQNGGATSRRYALLAPPAQMDVRDEVVPPMEATALSFTTAASASRSPTHRRPGSASNNNNKINAPFTSPTLSRPVSPAHPYGGMPVYATSRTTAMRSLSLNQRASNNNNTKTSSSSPQEMKENSPSVGVFFDDEPDKEALRALLLVARPSITTTTTTSNTTNNNNNVVVASTTISAAPVVGDVPRTSSAHNMGGTQSPDVLAKELVDDLPTKPSQQQQQQQQHNYHPRVSLEDLQRRDDVDDDLHHQLHAAQEKAEALARHLVKAMTDKRALQTNVLKLEELVEESSCEVGRLQRVVDAQQEEVRTSSGMEAALRAKEREVAVCDDEISRLTSMMDSHLARGVGVIDASSAMLVSQEVEAAMAEIGISHVAQREAEGRADQLAAELEVAVRQIHTLDEQLAEMERAATSQRLHEVRACLAVDADGDGGRSMSSNNNNNRGDAIPLPTSADASEWPVAARRAVARLVSYAEGLLQQNAQSARTSSREVHHLHARVDELRKDVAEQRAEAALATDACSNLRQEHHNLGRQSHAMMSALNDVRHGAQLVSEMVQSSKEEAEEVAQRVAGAAPFAQQVMRDMRAVARFLASLREMHIDEGCGAEMLRCIADGQSPAESLYRSPQKMMKADGTNNTTNTRADAQHRIAMKRSFVLNAVEAALQNNSGTNNTNMMMMSNRPSLMRESTSMRGRASVEAEEEEEEAVVVADAFDDEAMMMHDELHPRGRTQQQQRASEAGMIDSDNRYATRGGSQHQHPQHDARRRVYASTTSPLPVARPLQLSASPISPSHDEDATTPPQDDHDNHHHHRQIPSPDSSPIIHVPEGAQAARRIYDEDENDSRHSPHTQHNHHQHHHQQHSGVLDSAESASTMAYDPSQPPKDRSMTAIPSGGASNAHIHSIDRGVVLEVGQQGRRSRSIVGGDDDDDDDDDVVDADSALSPLRSREAAMRPTLPPTASSATTSVRPSSRTRRDDDDDDDYDNPALNFFESSGTFAGDAGLPTSSSSSPSNNNHNTSASSATHHHHPPPAPMHANNTNNNTMTSMHAGGPPQLQRSSTASPILPSDSSSAHFFSSAGNSRDISSHALPPPRRLSRDASASGTAPPPSLGETQRHPSPPTSTTPGLHDQDVLTGEVSPGSREATASPQRDDVRSMSPPQRRPDVIDAHAPSSSSPTTTTTSTSAPLGLPQPASGTPTLLQMPQPAEALPMAPPSQSLSRPQSRSNNNNNHDVMDGGAHSQRRAVPAEAPTTQPPRINEDEPAAMMMSGRPPLPPSSSASTPTTSSPTTTTTTHVRQPRASSADDDDDEPKPKPQTSAPVSARRGGSTASSSARSSCESGDDAQRKENVARILEKFRAKKAASQS